MISIRHSVFETNSSSMHAIVIPIDTYPIRDPIDICIDADIDFSERKLINRNTPSEKASYCFQMILNHWNSKLIVGSFDFERHMRLEITDSELAHNNRVIRKYRSFVSYMKKWARKTWNINVAIKNVVINSGKLGAYIGPSTYVLNGVVCNGGIKETLMKKLFLLIDKLASPESDIELKSRSSTDAFFDFEYLCDFIRNPNAIIIQNTDESDETYLKRMQRMVISCVKKSNGRCNVEWLFS